MKVYIKEPVPGAGKWIYRGYFSAWQSLGYDVEYYKNIQEVKDRDCYIMAVDGDVNRHTLPVLEGIKKVFLFSQPIYFPFPWGTHPNFVTSCTTDEIKELNVLDNVHKWTFLDNSEYYAEWQNLTTIPLAFDSINYKFKQDEKYAWDVCFIGGWADNGFNEKKKIMIDVFINQNISHEEETLILSSSKIAINIHDAYQRLLGFDTSERTFKSLGLCGFLISDSIDQYKRLFPDNPTANTSEQMISHVLKYMSEDLSDIKEKNRKLILKEHTYLNRVKQMMAL